MSPVRPGGTHVNLFIPFEFKYFRIFRSAAFHARHNTEPAARLVLPLTFSTTTPSIYSWNSNWTIIYKNCNVQQLTFLLFKKFQQPYTINPKEVFLVYIPTAPSRSSLPYLLKPVNATKKVSSILFYRCVDAWNTLSASWRLSSSLSAFRRGLKNIDLTRYLEGSDFNYV